MTTINKTFLIEANRENSVEIVNFGVDNALSDNDTAEWTNILKNCNLKKNDIITLDNAVINARGSNTSAMEFTGQKVDNNRLYTDNFAIWKFGHWICNNNEYSVGLPFAGPDKDNTAGESNLSLGNFVNNSAYGADSNESNPSYGLVQLPTGTYTKSNGDAIGGVEYIFNNTYLTGSVTAGWVLLTSYQESGKDYGGIKLECINNLNYGDNLKYALINVNYEGHCRPTLAPVTDWNADISSGEVKIDIEKGFEDPSTVADKITKAFSQTDTVWGGATTKLGAQPVVQNNNTNVIAGTSSVPGDNEENQAQLNGQMLLNTHCNGVVYESADKGEGSSGAGYKALYSALCTDEPVRFSTGVNCILQTTLVDVGKDIVAAKSPAYSWSGITPDSPLGLIGVTSATLGALTVTIDYGILPRPEHSMIGTLVSIVAGSGTDIFAPATSVTDFVLDAQPATTATVTIDNALTATPFPDPNVQFQGQGNFVTNLPVYLFTEYENNTDTYDSYCAHANVIGSYDLDGLSFTSSIGETWYFEKVGYKNLGNSGVQYNYNVRDTTLAGDIKFYAEWTGTNFDVNDNYILFPVTGTRYVDLPTQNNYFKQLFTYTWDGADGYIIWMYDDYDYSTAASNNWTNLAQSPPYREIGTVLPGGVFPVSEVLPANSKFYFGIKGILGKTENIRVYDKNNNIIYGLTDSTVTYDPTFAQITFSPALVHIDLDGCMFQHPIDGLLEFQNVGGYTPLPISGELINYEILIQSSGALWGYWFFNGLENSEFNKGYDTTEAELNESIFISVADGNGAGSFVKITNKSSLVETIWTWSTEPAEEIINGNFSGWDGVTMPDWSLLTTPADYDAAKLALGIVECTTFVAHSKFIRQTFSNLVVGQTYDLIITRDDILGSNMYVRTQNGLSNVNVLWDNGSTTNLRTVLYGATVSFEVLTACDGIEIYWLAVNQAISQVSIVEQGSTGGVGVDIVVYEETVWEANNSNPVTVGNEDIEFSNSTQPITMDALYADIPKHQIITTNIEYTEDNLKLLQKFMNGTEMYIGTEHNINDIENDNDNWAVRIDAGRTNDSIWTNEKFVDNYAGIGNAMAFSWQPNQDPSKSVIVAPRMLTGLDTNMTEQRTTVFSRYKTNAYNRLIYKLNNNAGYFDLQTTAGISKQKFYLNNPVDGTPYDDSLSLKYNVACYPVYYVINNDNLNPPVDFETHRVIAFELNDNRMEQPQSSYYKWQWGTAALFSPQMADANQCMLINNENSNTPVMDTPQLVASIKNTDTYVILSVGSTDFVTKFGAASNTVGLIFTATADGTADDGTGSVRPLIAYTTDIEQYTNYVNIGAGNMTVAYNNDLQRFTMSYFHIPRLLTPGSGATAQIGTEVASWWSSPEGLPYTTNGFSNTGKNIDGISQKINDMQCGNYLMDLFFQTENTFISNSNDSRVIKMTKNNYFGSLPWMMGFIYEDLKPVRFADKPFNNRYNSFYQNNFTNNLRTNTVSPLSTNSDVDISSNTALSVYPNNSQFFGQPRFGLGFNNSLPVNVSVQSAVTTATNLQVELNNGFYRIYCDLPLDSFRYIGSEQDLPAIGVCLRNYSTGGYFFGYATSYQIEVTRDIPLNTIRTIIRNGSGKIARNLNEKCCVFYKVQRSVVAGIIPDEPDVTELKDLNEKLSKLIEINLKSFELMNKNLELLLLPEKQRVSVVDIRQQFMNAYSVGVKPKSKEIKKIFNKDVGALNIMFDALSKEKTKKGQTNVIQQFLPLLEMTKENPIFAENFMRIEILPPYEPLARQLEEFVEVNQPIDLPDLNPVVQQIPQVLVQMYPGIERNDLPSVVSDIPQQMEISVLEGNPGLIQGDGVLGQLKREQGKVNRLKLSDAIPKLPLKIPELKKGEGIEAEKKEFPTNPDDLPVIDIDIENPTLDKIGSKIDQVEDAMKTAKNTLRRIRLKQFPDIRDIAFTEEKYDKRIKAYERKRQRLIDQYNTMDKTIDKAKEYIKEKPKQQEQKPDK